MIPLTLQEMQILIAASVFTLGCMCVLIGVFVLLSRGFAREIRSMAIHTARIGKKGLANEATGLVKSASELVGSINQLVRTASGAGAFLIFAGMIMLAGAYWIITKVGSLPF
jgi:hypothetical protein